MTNSNTNTAKKKINKSDILSTLRRQIITMELRPGAALDEAELCAKLEISRTPLREILILLSSEGYIQIRENRGTFVASMDYHTIRRLFQTAPMIYSAISRLAAENATSQQVDELAKHQSRFSKAMESQSIESMIYYNDCFHHYIGIIADNAFLMPSLKRLLIDHARIGNTFWNNTRAEQAEEMRQASKDHDQLIAAIADHDVETAVEITKMHWHASKGNINKYIMPDTIVEADDSKMG